MGKILHLRLKSKQLFLIKGRLLFAQLSVCLQFPESFLKGFQIQLGRVLIIVGKVHPHALGQLVQLLVLSLIFMFSKLF